MSKPIRILYVDDYPLDRELVRDALEEGHGGFRLTEAASRQEFEARLAEGEYDLVLSDFNILGYEGLDVIDAVRASDPRLPVVIVTGTGSEEIAVQAMKRGADDYVIKSPGQIRRLPHIIHTVLDKKRLEEEKWQALESLRESEERHRLLFCEMLAGSALHTIVCDDAGNPVDYVTLDVNKAYERILDVNREDVVAQRASAILSRDELQDWLEILGPVALTGKSTRYELYSPSNRKHFEGTAYSPVPGQFAATFHDITERKQVEEALRESEARYRSYVDNAPYGVFITDEQGNYLEVNDEACEITGYGRAELLSMSFSDLAVPESLEAGLAHFARVVSHGQASGEFLFVPKNGQRRHWCVDAVRLSEKRFLGFVQDITERVQAEQALQQLYEQTRQDAETKTTLLQEVHHRVKNNLQIIASLLDLQADQVRDPEVLHALQNSRHRVRAMALVHESLYQTPDLARPDLGRYVQELLDYLIDAYEGPAAAIDLDVQVEAVSLDLDQAIPCGLILTELVINAVKHAFPPCGDRPAGQAGTLQIALHVSDDEVELTVGDNGIGLPAELDPQTTSSLGLRIVQLLTRQLKGRLEVNSAVDKGTTFTIVFPLTAEEGA